MPNVEHYQNQFILQRDILDIIRHDFKQHENKIEATPSNKPCSCVMQRNVKNLVHLKRYFKELRNEFQAFIHKEAFS